MLLSSGDFALQKHFRFIISFCFDFGSESWKQGSHVDVVEKICGKEVAAIEANAGLRIISLSRWESPSNRVNLLVNCEK